MACQGTCCNDLVTPNFGLSKQMMVWSNKRLHICCAQQTVGGPPSDIQKSPGNLRAFGYIYIYMHIYNSGFVFVIDLVLFF